MATSIFDSFTKTFKDFGTQYKSTGEGMAKKYAADAQAKAKEFSDKSSAIIKSSQGQSRDIFDKIKSSIPSRKARKGVGSRPVSSLVPMSQIPKKQNSVFQLKSKKTLPVIPIVIGAIAGIYFLTKRTKRRK